MKLHLLLYCFLFFNAIAADEICVCFVSDDKFMRPTTVAAASILKNADPEDNLYFYIIDMGISKERKEKILKLKKVKPFKIDFFSMNDGRIKQIPVDRSEKSIRLGRAAYGRIFLCDLLKNVKKILYLDGDIIVRKSLKELWETDITNNYLAAVVDFIGYKTSIDHIKFMTSFENIKSSYYFNSGMLLMNLEKFRKDKIPELAFYRIMRLFEIGKLLAHDQDVLNNLLGYNTKIIDPKFNYIAAYDLNCFGNFLEIDARLKDARNNRDQNVIIHFAGENVKPWDWFNVIIDPGIQQEYFEALELTDYWNFKEFLHKYWSIYIWNKIVRISLFIYELFL